MAQYDVTVEVGAPYQIDVALTSTNVRPLWLSAWSSITTYAKNNMVKYAGSAWISLVSGNLNQQPDLTPLSWDLMVEKGDQGDDGPPATALDDGDWSIGGSNFFTDVTVTGATSNTKLAIGFQPPTGDPGDPGNVYQVPLVGGANTVRLSVTNAPGTGNAFNGVWTALRL